MRLTQLLHDQNGVVSRRRVLEAGHDDTFIEGMLRRREWARIHPGVYVEHTGRPTWHQYAWAAVLHYEPAALSHGSALGPPPPEPRIPGVDPDDLIPTVDVAIEHPRKAVPVPGVRLHRVRGLHERVNWSAGPPRVSYEEAVLDEASRCPSPVSALALISDVCRSRRTTPARVLQALRARPRLRHRGWLVRALTDATEGALSVLESGYLRRVERAHGLPRGRRQPPEQTEDGVVYRDVRYGRYRLVVELDGRIGHEDFHDRAADRDRDLLAAADDLLTIRLGWQQVERRPCETAARLARVLQRRGWRGTPVPCGPDCPIREQRGRSSADTAGDRPR